MKNKRFLCGCLLGLGFPFWCLAGPDLNKKTPVLQKAGIIPITQNVICDQTANCTISGQAKDANGDPLPGASVTLKDSSTGTITDLDGNYTIVEVPCDGILIFCFIGYKCKEVAVDNRHHIDVVLDME